jgi:hypothetical protein
MTILFVSSTMSSTDAAPASAAPESTMGGNEAAVGAAAHRTLRGRKDAAMWSAAGELMTAIPRPSSEERPKRANKYVVGGLCTAAGRCRDGRTHSGIRSRSAQLWPA